MALCREVVDDFVRRRSNPAAWWDLSGEITAWPETSPSQRQPGADFGDEAEDADENEEGFDDDEQKDEMAKRVLALAVACHNLAVEVGLLTKTSAHRGVP